MEQFKHAMLREIYEQPAAIGRTIGLYLDETGLRPDVARSLAQWESPMGEMMITACGSSRHSGLAAQIMFEVLCGLAVDVEYASEYSCRHSPNLRKPSVIVLSQSGETSDTLLALREAIHCGQKTLAITNVADSSMAREANLSMPLGAGVESAVPATKSFTCQLTLLYLLALYEGFRLRRMEAAELAEHILELRSLPELIAGQLDQWRDQARFLAHKYATATSFLYLGRGIHYAIAREGALKMKEASYVHAEGYPTGELRHGPNALVSDQVPLVVVATQDRAVPESVVRYENTLVLLDDMKEQGAKVIAMANAGDERVPLLVDDCIFVQSASEYLLPISEVVPFQLFSYFMAIEHGIDMDRPRNLTKAVIAHKE